MKSEILTEFDHIPDKDRIQSLQEAFSLATGVASRITGMDGLSLVPPCNLPEECKGQDREAGTACILFGRAGGECPGDDGIRIDCGHREAWGFKINFTLSGDQAATWRICKSRLKGCREVLPVEGRKDASRAQPGTAPASSLPDERLRETCRLLRFVSRGYAAQCPGSGDRKDLAQQVRSLEKELRRSRKLEVFGLLTSGIVHDFNNILFPIIGYSEMLMDDLPETGRARERVQHVLEAAVKARELIQQVQTFSRGTEEEPRPLKIYLIVKEVFKFVRATLPSSVRMVEDISRDTGVVRADPSLVYQLVMTLITSICDIATGQGGEVIISLKNAHSDPPVSCPVAGVCLGIRYSGCGRAGGRVGMGGDHTGLPASVLSITRELKGEISVKSTADGRECVEVFLPGEGEPGQRDAAPSLPLPKGSETVLVIDDETSILNMVGEGLSRLGYKVM
ncbi:MAG: hypothetical protein MI863_07615, partial [Desulfobacterales bacterium]|nr:hypothetical protein [Desulfobacterales bacterium]